MTDHELSIRPAVYADQQNIWQTLEPTIRAGESVALDRDLTRAAALDYWFSARHEVFVAEQEGAILGTYFLRANQDGGGAHVANSVYVVSPSATGRGIAQAMCEHSLSHARARGFLAMQFNFVLGSEERRLKLWQRAGFKVVGTLPKAFRHPSLGLIDAFVLYREL
ncbi:MAG TPA: GNAT family N-acetyltransferase [Polyangiaceae bacterium]|nr:GNAT family N-acetyltransferase [Polyangiaceae bacterium]